MRTTQTRRDFLTTMWLASAAALLPTRPALTGEVLETKTVRIAKSPGGAYGESDCWAPEFLANELLYAEGFTDIRNVDATPPSSVAVARGEVDFAMGYASVFASAIDAGQPITVLAGVMVGCIEVFANEDIHTIADLKRKRVGIQNPGSSAHILLSIMSAEIGLDPVKDIHWINGPSVRPLELFAAGKIDAFLSSPPASLDLRARRIGHVILNTAVDRPWSQYFCCMLAGNRDYVRNYPVATKRVLRAILKAADLCAAEPAGTARRMVEGGFTPRYEYALQMFNEVSYDKWREYDPEDAMRFYALRMREAGFIKSSPQKIIAEGTDWRFLSELKQELKV